MEATTHTEDSTTRGMPDADWRQQTFDEAIDVSDEMRRYRRIRRGVRVMYVIGALLIVIAICIGGFPKVLQYRSSMRLSRTSAQSARAVANWPYTRVEDTLTSARAYNERLAASGQPVLGEAKDPFAAIRDGANDGRWNDDAGASSNDEEYQRLLDSGGGVMGTVRIPKISVKLPIYHGTSQSALLSGAGHLYGSSLPVGGRSTHAVITGHRGLVSASMFTRLDEMRVGDSFSIDVMGHTLGYRVDRISVIEPDDTSKLTIVAGEDRMTLMTCTPYGVNTHRLLVSAVRSSTGVSAADSTRDVTVPALVVSGLTLVLGVAVLWWRRCPWHIRRHAAWWPNRR